MSRIIESLRKVAVNLDQPNQHLRGYHVPLQTVLKRGVDMPEAWMNASEAARRLKVSRQTLYAYVSRRLLQSERVAGSRSKRYRRSDIEKLVTRQTTLRSPKGAVQASLNWGLPVLQSALTTIKDGRLFYQGRDALALSDTESLEELAARLWDCEARDLFNAKVSEPSVVQLRKLKLSGDKPSPQRSLNAFMALVAQEDDFARGNEPLALQGAQLLYLMRAATTLLNCPSTLIHRPVHLQLQEVWKLNKPQGELIRRALILCADHELNVSSFTTRCVASSGARLDACVIAGMAALTGARHGGITSIIEDQWEGWMSLASVSMSGRERLLEFLEHPEEGTAPLDLGFGHPLYPNGDPRAKAILASLPADSLRSRLEAKVYAASGLSPSLDFALVALRRHLALPLGSAFALFAIGRVVGWIAHVIEQRKQGNLIRPRADYVGPAPGEAAPLKDREQAQRRVVRFR
jgi:citrate synthase